MRQTWRWFGPADEITITEIRQTGAEGIVSALHHVPSGDVWSVEEIKRRQSEITHPNGSHSTLSWDVVESLPVSESIKSQSGSYKEHFASYKESLENLADCGLSTICYNFMPVLDWTRTVLTHPLEHGGTTMLFDLLDFVAFDLFILKRANAVDDYSEAFQEMARERFAEMDDDAKSLLARNVVAGLPGANDNWTLDEVQSHLDRYNSMSAEQLRSNLVDFLSEVVPLAEELGIRLCCHPDDPPFPLLGLPRVMSNENDYQYIMDAVDSPSSGVTFCTGSLGVAEQFDPVQFIKNLGNRIHFVHLRNTMRHEPTDGNRCSFYESEHLDGDTNLVLTIQALLDEEKRRRIEGRSDHEIPMRPDHGQSLISDLDRPMMPGYPLIGRLRGLAELRGVMMGLNEVDSNSLR